MDWLLIGLTLLLSGFFSGSEIAFISASKLKMDVEARKKGVSGRALRYFMDNPENFLTTTLVGNNIVNVLYATLMAVFLHDTIAGFYAQSFGHEASAVLLLIVETFIASVLIMLVGEVLPKAIFRVHADAFVKVIIAPQRMINIILKPLIWIAEGATSLLFKLIPGALVKEEQRYQRTDLLKVFQELRDQGGEDLDKEDTEILHNVLELYNKRVKEVMIPRTDIEAVEQNDSIEDVLQVMIKSGHSKLPVYNDSIDDVVGVIFTHDLFSNPETIQDVIRPIKLVPGSKRTRDLLSEFQAEKISLAIVLDEYGGTAGLVTIEDLLEEVVGDIQDEYDREDYLLKKLSDTEYVMSGNMELDDLIEKYPSIPVPDKTEDYETVAGYIMHHSGRLPSVNDEIAFDGFKFIISKASPSRIQTVKLVLVPNE